MGFHLHGKEQLAAPTLLALNPEGKVPTLLVDGRPLTEVAAILFYLARRLPGSRSGSGRPTWIWRRGRSHGCRSSRRPSMPRADKATEARPGEAFNHARAPGRPRLGDRAYSIVDIHLFRLYWRFEQLAQATADVSKSRGPLQRMIARPRRAADDSRWKRRSATSCRNAPVRNVTPTALVAPACPMFPARMPVAANVSAAARHPVFSDRSPAPSARPHMRLSSSAALPKYRSAS